MGYLAVSGMVVFWLAALVVNFHRVTRAIANWRERRKFQEFEAVLSDPDGDPQRAQKFFSEDVILAEDISILIPVFIEYQELVENYQVPLVAAWNAAGLVEDTRAYTLVDNCGVDLRLNNFVSGVELLRSMLMQLKVPRGTLIEYSGGDLPIYED